MEDRGTHKEQLDSDSNTAVFAIFDGHLGSALATFLRIEMIDQFEEMLKDHKEDDLTDFFKPLFDKVDHMPDPSTYPETGSCASLVVIRKEGNKQYLY
jgi:protein phosphatase PTC1